MQLTRVAGEGPGVTLVHPVDHDRPPVAKGLLVDVVAGHRGQAGPGGGQAEGASSDAHYSGTHAIKVAWQDRRRSEEGHTRLVRKSDELPCPCALQLLTSILGKDEQG
jgi:hypothetical protein